MLDPNTSQPVCWLVLFCNLNTHKLQLELVYVDTNWFMRQAMVRKIWRFLNRRSNVVLWGGLALVAQRNYQQWGRDQTAIPMFQSRPVLERTPSVSVIVAAWNEATIIVQHIEAFLALEYPAKQLVLCAGGKDGTLDIANQYADGHTVIVIEQDAGKGKQVALRKALPYATGEIIYLTDADCLLNDDAFIRTIAPIANGRYQVVNGASRPLSSQATDAFVMYQWVVDYYATMYSPEHSNGLLGRNCAINAEALRSTGGFDAEAKSGTDYTLARQLIDAGYVIYNEKQSWVETDYPATLDLYYYKRSRWLRNTLVLGYQKKDYRSMLPSALSSAVGIFMLFTPIAAMIMGPFVGAVWLVLLVHASLSRVRYVWIHAHTMLVSPLKVTVAGLISLPIDFYVASTTFLQAIIPQWRSIWR